MGHNRGLLQKAATWSKRKGAKARNRPRREVRVHGTSHEAQQPKNVLFDYSAFWWGPRDHKQAAWAPPNSWGERKRSNIL